MSTEEKQSTEFTQRDLMIQLLHMTQHAVTREEMGAQFAKAERQVDQRFEQVDQRFEQVDQRFDRISMQLEKLDKKYDRLVWFLFAGLAAVVFKEQIVALLGLG